MPAILGDRPAFDKVINIVRPVFPDLSEFEDDFRAVLKSGQVTNNSRFVREFESHLAHFLKVKYCLAFCNGETALICMLKAARLSGDIIVPSYTFSGTVHAAIWNSLNPIFADIDPETLTVDPASVEEQVGERTTAILAAPLYGNPCDNDALQTVASRYGLQLLFDSASGFGPEYHGVRLGTFGNAEIFSFHATKVFSTMEGGALATNDPQLYELARQLRSFGQIGKVDCRVAGLNGKMMEVAALVGITFLRNFEAVIRHRIAVAEQYEHELAQVPGLRFQKVHPENMSTRLYFVVLVDSEAFGLDRDELVKALKYENITARRFLDPPVHRMTCYKNIANDVLPRTDYVSSHAMALPIFSDMREEEVKGVCNAIAGIYDRRQEVRIALQHATFAA